MAENNKIVGFKKFTDIKSKSKVEEVDPSIVVNSMTNSDIPMNPNIPKNSKKIEKPASRKNLMPEDQDINLPSDSDEFENDIDTKGDKTHESKLETFGKVVKFPKNTKASKAYNFMENVRISKKSIWYIMIEKMQTQNMESLQMIKYNTKEGVDLNKFVNELKTYYIKKYSKDKKICESISNIKVDGNDKYSIISSIPLINIDDRKMISIITEDLIRLLSK